MAQTKKLAENKNFTAVNIGRLDEVKNYSLIHPKSGKEVKGKLFLKDETQSTGTEISFTFIPPHSEIGYFHIHNKDEETYLILSGEGYYQVDDDCFPIQQGSVIRVAPEGVRSIANSSDEDLVYICVQSKQNSLEEHTSDDGERLPYEAKWPAL